MRVSQEQLRFEETMRSKTPRQILANARRIACRRLKRAPNWVLAMDVFAVGSTYAHWICKDAGIDPDSTKTTAFPVEAKVAESTA